MSHRSGGLFIRNLLHGRIILFALLWCSLPATDAPAQYRFDSWTTDNGLPQVSVNSIIQTRDGFLWFTTFGGIVRYDGLRFHVFNTGNTEGLKTSRFGLMMEDREGFLWINTEGQGVTCYKDGKFTTYTSKANLPEHIKNQISEDAKGNLFLRIEEVVAHPTGYVTSSEAPRQAEPIEGILQKTRDGAIWYMDGANLKKMRTGA